MRFPYNKKPGRGNKLVDVRDMRVNTTMTAIQISCA